MLIIQDRPKFSRYLFWDTDPDKVNFDKNARYVIEKIVSRGQIEDWNEMKRYYGLDKVKEETKRIRYLDSRILNFLATFFGIPREEFRCYTQKQWYLEH